MAQARSERRLRFGAARLLRLLNANVNRGFELISPTTNPLGRDFASFSFDDPCQHISQAVSGEDDSPISNVTALTTFPQEARQPLLPSYSPYFIADSISPLLR
jgi:hypothetical protein